MNIELHVAISEFKFERVIVYKLEEAKWGTVKGTSFAV